MSVKAVEQNGGLDKLSSDYGNELDLEQLDSLVKSLDSEQIERECGLRNQLIANRKQLRADRYEQGHILKQYRDLYRQDGQWLLFCKAIGVNDRTARRLIEGYSAAAALPEPVRQVAAKQGVDLAAKKNHVLTSELTKHAANEVTDSQARDIFRRTRDKIRAKQASVTLSPEERVDKVYKLIQRLYGRVSPEQRINEFQLLRKKVDHYFSIPSSDTDPDMSLMKTNVFSFPSAEAS